ncbi:PQQ-binding-like beta-propeller repeat protein [Streptomyces sp. NPDC048258]|uniref:outer membrane protein assembly factor BamB family protein n=1 Tax=Streptomyces sp. NPDC048258 TaxID=3365527 RepID=UPI0037214D1C
MDTPPPFAKRLRDHVRLTAACAFSAVAVLYAVLCVKSTAADTSGDLCGIGGCPRGLGPLVLWALVAALAAGGLWRSAVKGRGYRSAVGWVAAVAVALVALWPGRLGFSWLRGPHMDLFGYQIPEGAAAGKPLGSWASPPTSGFVIRVRTDGVTGYDGEGRRGWRLGPPPAGGEVCGMSPDAPSGTGVLAYTAAGQDACGTRLVAVDVISGEKRWVQDIPNPTGNVSAVGSLAVTATADAVLAYDLRTGKEAWRTPLRRPADVTEVLAGPDRVLVAARSGSGSELIALDARTGAVAWQATRPAGTEPPRLVSARPAAVVADGHLLTFDDAGRPRGGPEQSPYVPDPDGRHRVLGDVLIVPVPEREKREVLAAYSLTDGSQLWTRAFDQDWKVRAVGTGRSGRIAVVTQGAYTHLWHLDPRTGQPAGESTVLRDLPMGESIALYGRTFVNLDPGGQLPPIFDVDPVFGW